MSQKSAFEFPAVRFRNNVSFSYPIACDFFSPIWRTGGL